ncbi:MAG TPA: amidase family protein [Solirubrobacterales bacterium]|jgi:amidase
MFSQPRVAEVRAIAEAFGVHLDAEELEAYTAQLGEQLTVLDEFLQDPAEEDRPPLLFPERTPGHRPGPDEDPHRAWLWRCEVGGAGEGLLAGKTVGFKDHISVAGVPLTIGTRTLDGFVPDFDATVVTNVLAAGGTVAGKNTHHGFGGLRSMAGQLGDYWDAVNPHDQTRQTGGSSSGSAVAVAVGDADVAIGGDQGGSIRHPAAYCGVVGMKPTFGLVSHMGATYGGDPSIDHLGPMARTVAETATALEAIAGYDPFDQRTVREVPDHIDVLTKLDDGPEDLTIGVLAEGFDQPIESELRDAVLVAIDAVAEAGAKVVRISVPEHRQAPAAAGALQLAGYRAARGSGGFGFGARGFYPEALIGALDRSFTMEADQLAAYIKFTWMLGELSQRNFHGAVYAKAQNRRPAIARAYDRALGEVDVLAMPTCHTVAPPIPAMAAPADAWRRELDVPKRIGLSFRNLQPFNYTGHPALALPCGKVGGLPVSLQLVGRHFDDATVLRAARACEQAVGYDSAPVGGARR